MLRPAAAAAASPGGMPACIIELPGLPDFEPRFLQIQASNWRKRVEALERFVGAARTVVLRVRAGRRLVRLQALVAAAAAAGPSADVEELAAAAAAERLEATRPGAGHGAAADTAGAAYETIR